MGVPSFWGLSTRARRHFCRGTSEIRSSLYRGWMIVFWMNTYISEKKETLICGAVEDRVKEYCQCRPKPIEADSDVAAVCDVRSVVDVLEHGSRTPESERLQSPTGLSNVCEGRGQFFVGCEVPHTVVVQEHQSSDNVGDIVSPNSIPDTCLRSGLRRDLPNPVANRLAVGEKSGKKDLYIDISTEHSTDCDSDPTWQPGTVSSLSSSSYCSRSESASSSENSLRTRWRSNSRRSDVVLQSSLRKTEDVVHIGSASKQTITTNKDIGLRRKRKTEQGRSDSALSRDSDRTWRPRLHSRLSSQEHSPTSRRLRSQVPPKITNPARPLQTFQTETDTVGRQRRESVIQKSRMKEMEKHGRSKTGKEKETFEVWSVPRNRGKPGTRANPTEQIQNKDISVRGKEKRTQSVKRNPEPKGMKRSEVAVGVDKNSSDSLQADRVGDVEKAGNGGQGNDFMNSQRKTDGRGPRIESSPVEEVELPRKKAVVHGATTEFYDGSDLEISGPEMEDRAVGKGSPSYVNIDSHENDFKKNATAEHVRARTGSRYSPGNRKALKSAKVTPTGRGISLSDSERDERRQSLEYDSYNSRSPDRNGRGKRPRHERRRRRSYNISEDEMYHRRRITERRSSRRSGCGGPWDYNPQHGESSRYGRRRLSRRSDSEDGNERDYNREDRSRSWNSSEEEFRRGRHAREVALKGNPSSPHDENAKRRERRHKQSDREAKVWQRESQGLKGHYIAVDEHGEPYSYGKGAWRLELNKLCGSLDPSVMDIRWQLEEDMKILRRRLKESFEYSAPISRAYIRTLAGRNVTQRRNRIINSMEDNAPCPAGMNAEVWKRLNRIRQNPRREELSQRMRYANSCRRQVGRTGPKGISGVRDDLRDKLGREADPDELEEELRRDKGYGGCSQKAKVKVKKISSESDSDVNAGTREEDRGSSDSAPRQITWSKGETANGNEGDGTIDKEYIRSLEKRIEQLTTRNRGAEVSGGSTCNDAVRTSVGARVGNIGRQVEINMTATALALGEEELDNVEGNAKTTDLQPSASPSKRKRKVGRR